MITPFIILVLPATGLLAESAMAWMQRRCIRAQAAIVGGLIIVFLFIALGHFVRTEGMIVMLPGRIPCKASLIYLGGAWEILIAIDLFSGAYRQAALVSAVVRLTLIFSVNIYAAVNFTGFGGHQWGPVYLIIRWPLQALLIAWCSGAYSPGKHLPGDWLCRRGHLER